MSEFTNHYKNRADKLYHYILGLYHDENGSRLLEKYGIMEHTFMPREVMMALDRLVESVDDFEKIKSVSNKLFNILYKSLQALNASNQGEEIPLQDYLQRDNEGLRQHLKHTRSLIKNLNKNADSTVVEKLIQAFEEIERFGAHYAFMQNVVFPEIENKISYHRCLKIMWSFQDDIISNTRKSLEALRQTPVDLSAFNRYSSRVYFNAGTIAFREEQVLFPLMMDDMEPELWSQMLVQLKEFTPAFVDTSGIQAKPQQTLPANEGLIGLSTGKLSIEQIELIFKYLPVDITYVDENDEVRFYSDPPHRIFPRTKSIVGRKVQNCHPHESVHIVNKIVESFKRGEQDEAAFWIKIGARYVLIKYYAMRSADGAYKGVLEVSQEISDIQQIKGEKRLLDW